MSIAFRDLPVQDLLGATRDFEQLVALKLSGSLEGTLDEPILRKEIVTKEKLAKPEAWKGVEALGFEHEWKNFGAGIKAEYRKSPFSSVELRGKIASGKLGESAFKLPAGYLPKEPKQFVVISSGGSGSVKIEATGAVIIENFGGEAKTFILLDQVSFSVE